MTGFMRCNEPPATNRDQNIACSRMRIDPVNELMLLNGTDLG